MKLHYNGVTTGTIYGVLYRGDAKTKYTTPNSPTVEYYQRVDPKELALINRLNNRDEASQFMLHQIDTNDNERQTLPSVPNFEELTTWKIPAERHFAYASLWRYLTFIGVFANTALWLYF